MSTTWSSTGPRSVKAVCTTGNESAPSNPAKATVTVAFSSAVAGNTVTIRGKTFTAIANGATPADGFQFAVGAGGSANTDTGAAFAAAINAISAELGYTATNASGTVTLASNCVGTYANGWPVTKVGAPITLGAAAFASGVSPVGLSLDGVGALCVFLDADATRTLSGAGKLGAYLLNDLTGLYAPCPDLDLSVGVSGVRSSAWTGVKVDGPRKGCYLAYVPVGVTISAGGTTVHINATKGRPGFGEAL